MNKFLGIERNVEYGLSKLLEFVSVNPVNLMPISSIVISSDVCFKT